MSRSAARFALGALIVVTAIAIPGCGENETTDDEYTDGRAGQPTKDRASGLLEEVQPYRKPTSQEPRADIPLGPPPRELEMKDLRRGTGPEIKEGDEAIVNYVGYHYASRRQYDSSYGSATIPYKVTPGAGDLIEGFEQGIVGMRLHGRRQVTIPPHLGYGQSGYNDAVAPGETLVFVIDVEAVEKH